MCHQHIPTHLDDPVCLGIRLQIKAEVQLKLLLSLEPVAVQDVAFKQDDPVLIVPLAVVAYPAIFELGNDLLFRDRLLSVQVVQATIFKNNEYFVLMRHHSSDLLSKVDGEDQPAVENVHEILLGFGVEHCQDYVVGPDHQNIYESQEFLNCVGRHEVLAEGVH